MSRRFRLATVLRARQAKEDAAKGALGRARGEVDAAQTYAERRGAILDATHEPQAGPAWAVIASVIARQSLAADLSAARAMIAQAEEQAAARNGELTEAARQRRTVEKLADRHVAEVRREDEAREQAALDELATTAKQNRTSQHETAQGDA